ncbi:hypothetical protein J1N35_022626 [Gossypium stocksii]|uniref:Uncharacterized protein n=1 Tax=Gossypium stocksii TaxID=47602 RepID=A0A9D3VGD8_9ROSI|nr:hypothetical protein J1N35_022626 [Gossypium stocksii]
MRYIFGGTFVPSILRLHADVDANANTEPNANISKFTDGNTDTNIDVVIDARVYADVSKFCNFIQLFIDSVTNTHHIIILSGGSSVQPPSCGVENTRWKARTTSHSSTKEGTLSIETFLYPIPTSNRTGTYYMNMRIIEMD